MFQSSQTGVSPPFKTDSLSPEACALTDYPRRRQLEIAAQQTSLLYRQLLPSLTVTLINTFLLVIALWNVVDRIELLTWALIMLLVVGLRGLLLIAYQRTTPPPQDARPWTDRFILGAGLAGIAWGFCGIALFPAHSPVHQVFIAFVLGGMVAGAVPYLSSVPAAYLSFLLPCTLPYGLRLLAADGVETQAMGIMIFLFVIMMALSSRRMYRTIVETLNLRFDNRHLSRSLSTEISGRVQAEDAVKAGEQRFRELADASFEGILIHDQGTILAANRTLADIIGTEPEDLVGKNVLDFVVPAYKAQIISRLATPCGEPFESRVVRADGTAFPVEVQGRDLSYAGRTVRVAAIRDITERKAVDARLRRLATTDPMTGLANRGLFAEHQQRAIARAQRGGHQVAFLFLDLDDFKLINDTLGHTAGDMLLREAARRIKSCVRDTDTIARWGGDEFTIILEFLTDPNEAAVLAQKVIQEISRPITTMGHEVVSAVSIGISIYPLDGDNPDTLLKNADAAMYRAKEKGHNNIEFFTRDITEKTERRFGLESSLRRALERDEFVLHYQPKIELEYGQVTGVEALIRWNCPERGLVPPDQFIPLAEQTGLIVPMGEWVLRSACAQMQRWQAQGLPAIPVAVNLSLRQLKHTDIVGMVNQILEDTRVDPCHLELEITEGSLAEDVEHAVGLLEDLNDRGVMLSIDDFGTGYSSLSHLKRFPVDCLKIDRSFIRNIPDDSDDAAIALAVIAMADSLGLKVVAEGVETPEQLAFLKNRGCYSAQGYLFSRPLPAEQLAEWLLDWTASATNDPGSAPGPISYRFNVLQTAME